MLDAETWREACPEHKAQTSGSANGRFRLRIWPWSLHSGAARVRTISRRLSGSLAADEDQGDAYLR
jgi:hypothetical protein